VSAEGSLLACEELKTSETIDNAVINLRFVDVRWAMMEVSRNGALRL